MRPVNLTNPALGWRNVTAGRAYSLSEPGQPKGRPLPEIIDWLNVEKNLRYLPNDAQTFCNIYAHDVCYIAGVYLPRVWWMDPDEVGVKTAVLYAKTIRELSANGLYDWLVQFGGAFGWQPVENAAGGQQLANDGHVVVISAAQKDPARSGHISVIAPETNNCKSTGGLPVQSQAGRHNYCASCTPGEWWKDAKYRGFGIWSNKAVQTT